MSLDPRADALLAKYPDQLEEDELAELRAMAESDFLVAAMMDSIHEAESLLQGGGELDEMSEAGRELLDSIVTETLGENPDIDLTVEEIFAPPPPPEEVPEDAAETIVEGDVTASTEEAVVVPLASRRGGGMGPALAAIAALLLVGLAVVLWAPAGSDAPLGPGTDGPPRSDGDLQVRGGDKPGEEGPDLGSIASGPSPENDELVVMGPDVPGAQSDAERVATGVQRRVDLPITFEAVLTRPTSLALLGVEDGGPAWVIYPPPGGSWSVGVGANFLHPEEAESPEYRPSGPGRVSYVLVGADSGTDFGIPEERQVESVEALVTSSGAKVLDTLVVEWVAAP